MSALAGNDAGMSCGGPVMSRLPTAMKTGTSIAAISRAELPGTIELSPHNASVRAEHAAVDDAQPTALVAGAGNAEPLTPDAQQSDRIEHPVASLLEHNQLGAHQVADGDGAGRPNNGNAV